MVTLSHEEYSKIKERQEKSRAKSLGITPKSICTEKRNNLCISEECTQETQIIVIYGRIPSKKNSKRIAWSGRPTILSSEKYLEWENKTIEKIDGFKLVLQPPYKITVRIWYPDNRKADNSNKFESIADMLVKAKILEDDSWKILTHTEQIAMGVDKENPRAEIVFSKKVQ